MIIKNSLIYLGASVFSKSIPFLLLPVMTSYLSPEEYGKLSLYLLLITIYTAFIGMNSKIIIDKNYYTCSKEEFANYIGNILYILFFTFSIYTLITVFLTNHSTSIFSISSEWFLLIPFISIMIFLNEMHTTLIRMEQKAYTFGILEISNTFFKMGLTVLMLVVFSLNWYSQIVATLISSLLFFIIGILYLKNGNYIDLSFNMVKIKNILNVSIPMVPHVLGGVIIAVSDRLFIEKMVSLDAVGIYSVGYMFGMIIMLFTDAFIKSWTPWFYKKLANPTKEDKKNIVKYTYIYIVSIFLLAIIITYIGKFLLPYVVDEKFIEASKFIFWISMGYVSFGIYQIFFPYIIKIDKTYFLAISTSIAAIINLIFNYFFIKEFGTIGAAYSTVLAFSVSAFLVFIYQSTHYNMPWNLLK